MIVKVYQGSFGPDALARDVKLLPLSPAERTRRALPFEGILHQDLFQRNDFTYGVAFYQRGFLKQAEAAFQQVIVQKPDDPEAYYNLGTLYLRKNSPAEARKHLEKHAPPGVSLEMTNGHSGPWYLTDPHTKFGEAAQRALGKAFDREVALIREGGSIPIVSEFRTVLGVETLLIGLALPGCRAHSPNESFPLENLDAGIRMNKAVLQEVAS